MFVPSGARTHRDVGSLPTRRSSDLGPVRQSDEVHDRALERARVTEVTVHQIPRGPTHHQAECHRPDRKSTRLNSSHVASSYAVFCLTTKKASNSTHTQTRTAGHRGN